MSLKKTRLLRSTIHRPILLLAVTVLLGVKRQPRYKMSIRDRLFPLTIYLLLVATTSNSNLVLLDGLFMST